MKKIIMAIACGVLAAGIGFATVGCGGSGGTEIVVFNRESGSGTRDAFIEILGIEATELYAGAAQHSSTSAVVKAVAGDANGIGYISLGSLDNTVKALSVDGVAPSETTVANGTYKVARPFELMYQTNNNSDLLAGFLSYMQSEEAQATIADEGYVSIRSDAAAYAVPTEQFKDPNLDISGSTSVGPLMEILAEDYKALIKEELGQDIEISVGEGGSGKGIENAESGTSDIGMASKEVTAADFNDGSKMTILQLCSDGIAVIVNPANSVTNITRDALKAIYTGETTAWEDIEGWVAPVEEE